jgi:hypothetical protein
MAAKKAKKAGSSANGGLSDYYKSMYSSTSSMVSQAKGKSPSASTRAASGQRNMMRFGEEIRGTEAKKATQKARKAAGVPSSYSKNRRGTR